MAVLLAKNALPRSLDVPPPEVTEDLAQLPNGFGQQALGGASLNLKKMATPPGAWRLRTGDWRSIFFQSGGDFIVAAIGRRRDIYERAARMRLARRGRGVTVIEAATRDDAGSGARATATTRRRASRPKPVEQNGFSPFEDAMLCRIEGVDEDLLAFLRGMPPTVDAPTVLAERVPSIDLAFLLADLWERQQHHLDTFAKGGVPSVEDLAIEEAELSERLRAPDNATEFIPVDTAGQLRRLLDGSIEEWMVYLHPSQRAIANATFNGPSRVRGGPGTGKTVVALHRARVLARKRVAASDKVLLTTFLSTLPKVWTSLMELLDHKALAHLELRNVDVLARDLVAAQLRKAPRILSEDDRRKLVEPLLRKYKLDEIFGGNTSLLLSEWDGFIAGRGIDEPDEYFSLRRRGGGSGLGRPDRERVFAAYNEYRGTMKRRDLFDWPRIRAEALAAAQAGAGPRYDGVIIDEAQDLSAVGMRLLLELDQSEGHRHFMIVGDGQQSIYPGGFSLREIGVDIVGRSRVLTANWRNTWNIWHAARAVVEGQEFDDLDDEVGLRPTGEEPEPLTLGDEVELHVLGSTSEELELLAALVGERLEARVDPGDVAILVDVKRKGDDAIRALRDADIPTHRLEQYEGEHANGVLVGTLNRAKGLEFKEVFIPGLSSGEWPSRWFVPRELRGEARAEQMGLQLRTLFVGMTRARDRLVLLSGGAPAEALRQAEWALDVREY